MDFSPHLLDSLSLEAGPELLSTPIEGMPDVARLALARAMTFFGACRGTVTRVHRVDDRLLARVIWSAATGGGPTHEGAEFYEDAFPVTLPLLERGYGAWWGTAAYDGFAELGPLADADLPGGGYIIIPAHFHGEFAGFVSFDLPSEPVPFTEELLSATRRWTRTLLGGVKRYEAAAYAKEVEARLMRKQRLESLGTMAGGIAHDFNNLLVVMQGFAHYAVRSIPTTDPGIAEMASSFGEAMDRAAQLTAQLLLFAHDSQPVLKGVDLRDSLARIITMARRLVPESAEISLFIGDDVAIATVEAVMLDQALLNLIKNASDAMPKGGQITVIARGRAVEGTHDRVTDIVVRDTGVGMTSEQLRRAREPFFTTKAAGAGSGLGLAMAQAFVDRVGGELTIASTLGVGTEVTLTLRQGSAVAKEIERAIDTSGGTETLLLVEDSNIVRRVADSVLRRAGYKVVCACDGEEALELFARHDDIRLIVSDVVMPRMSGYVMAMEIRRTHPNLPILFCSGYDLGSHPDEFESDEYCDAIRKPYSPESLLGHVRGLLNRAPADAHLPVPRVG